MVKKSGKKRYSEKSRVKVEKKEEKRIGKKSVKVE